MAAKLVGQCVGSKLNNEMSAFEIATNIFQNLVFGVIGGDGANPGPVIIDGNAMMRMVRPIMTIILMPPPLLLLLMMQTKMKMLVMVEVVMAWMIFIFSVGRLNPCVQWTDPIQRKKSLSGYF